MLSNPASASGRVGLQHHSSVAHIGTSAPSQHRIPFRTAAPTHRPVAARKSPITRAVQAESFGERVRRIAKQVQGALPIVGLISRLTAPGGGFDELSYAEFNRSLYDNSSSEFLYALEDFEKVYGKIASSRWVLLMLWMSQCGPGLVAPQDVINAARRLRITQDMEIEIDRFENGREATLQKYQMMERPTTTLQEQLNLSVDALCTCCIGLRDGEPVPETDAPLLRAMVKTVYPQATDEQMQEALTCRAQRVVGYGP